MRDFQAYNISLDNENKFGCEFASNSSIGFGFYFVESAKALISESGGFVFIFIVRAIEAQLA